MPDPQDQAEERPSAPGERNGEGALARDLEEEAQPGKGINQAGYLKDQDAPSSSGSRSS